MTKNSRMFFLSWIFGGNTRLGKGGRERGRERGGRGMGRVG